MAKMILSRLDRRMEGALSSCWSRNLTSKLLVGRKSFDPGMFALSFYSLEEQIKAIHVIHCQ
jgi:hypothetical protein